MNEEDQLPDRLEQILASENLDELQLERLSRLTAYLLMGFVHPTEFVESITKDCEVENERAVIIAQEINKMIFSPAKNALQLVHEHNKKDSSITNISTNNTPVSRESHFTQTTAPAPLPPSPLTAATSSEMPAVEPKPHIGNIFEEKLGGSFRVKSDEVAYTASKTKADIPPIPRVTPPVSSTPSPIPASPSAPAPVATPPLPPTPPMPPTPPAPTAKNPDPYREAV